jgi:hypothetical protein
MGLRSFFRRARNRHDEHLVKQGLYDQQIGEPPLMASEGGVDVVTHVDDYRRAEEHVEHEHPPGTPE